MARTASTHARADTDSRIDAARHEVQQFLDRYATALTGGDVATIVSLWEVPAFVIDDADARAVGANEEIERFFAGAKQLYNDMGITGTRAEIVHLQWPTERIAVVDVRWPYLDPKGREVGEENSTYTLRRDADGELRLRVTLMHGAKDQGKQVGEPRH